MDGHAEIFLCVDIVPKKENGHENTGCFIFENVQAKTRSQKPFRPNSWADFTGLWHISHNRTIEANFNIRPLSLVLGPQGDTSKEAKMVKRILPIFFFFFHTVELISLPLQKCIGIPKFWLSRDFFQDVPCT